MHHAHMMLIKLRNDRGWSQRDLAEHTGLSQSKISRAENQSPTAMLETYKRLADEYGVTLQDIFSDDRTLTEVALLRGFRSLSDTEKLEWMAKIEMARGSFQPEGSGSISSENRSKNEGDE